MSNAARIDAGVQEPIRIDTEVLVAGVTGRWHPTLAKRHHPPEVRTRREHHGTCFHETKEAVRGILPEKCSVIRFPGLVCVVRLKHDVDSVLLS